LGVNGLLSRWMLRELRTGDEAPGAVASACARPLIDRVLAARSIETGAAFLDPRLTELHDPSLMPDMDRAAERILAALEKAEPLAIYGDYDADGITATAILYHMARHLRPEADVRTYVPHRMEEGYGLNSEAIASLAQAGCSLIISVDCGITSVGPAKCARELGVDLIITDHHTPPHDEADLPDAFAIVHPRRPGSTYPFGELCGAGVAYKLAWRLATLAAGSDGGVPRRLDASTRALLVDLLAYAALGSIADVVPLVDENRVIARHGLSRVRGAGVHGQHAARFIGLRALVEASGLAGENVSAMDVGFKLAPRLNAAGRLGHARSAVELLTQADESRAAQIAGELSKQNDQRRAVEAEIFTQAAELAQARGMTEPGRHAIVLADPRWHPGVVGIVCSRMVERFRRPTILMRSLDGVCQGSGRSIDGFSLHAALDRLAPMLDRFGGHDMAAGLALSEPRLEEFTRAFIDHASGAITPAQLTPVVTIDCEAHVRELSLQAVQSLARLGPFGRGNSEVRLLVRSMRIAAPPRTMGAHAKHLAVQLSSADAGNAGAGAGGGPGRGVVLRAVGWNWGEHASKLRAGRIVDVVIEPKISTWNGGENVEAELRDVRLAGAEG